MTYKAPTIDTTKGLELFLDMDGVFTDFEGHFFKLFGRRTHEVKTGTLWSLIHSRKTFFLELPLMPDAEHLWDYAKQFKPTFLTGAPSSNTFREQKKIWVAEKFGPEHTTIVLPKKDKQLHSGPMKVLIDDTPINIDQWVAKGGYGFLHKGDVKATIAAMEELRAAL